MEMTIWTMISPWPTYGLLEITNEMQKSMEIVPHQRNLMETLKMWTTSHYQLCNQGTELLNCIWVPIAENVAKTPEIIYFDATNIV